MRSDLCHFLSEEEFWLDQFNQGKTFNMPMEIFNKFHREKMLRIKSEHEKRMRELDVLSANVSQVQHLIQIK